MKWKITQLSPQNTSDQTREYINQCIWLHRILLQISVLNFKKSNTYNTLKGLSHTACLAIILQTLQSSKGPDSSFASCKSLSYIMKVGSHLSISVLSWDLSCLLLRLGREDPEKIGVSGYYTEGHYSYGLSLAFTNWRLTICGCIDSILSSCATKQAEYGGKDFDTFFLTGAEGHSLLQPHFLTMISVAGPPEFQTSRAKIWLGLGRVAVLTHGGWGGEIAVVSLSSQRGYRKGDRSVGTAGTLERELGWKERV